MENYLRPPGDKVGWVFMPRASPKEITLTEDIQTFEKFKK